MQLPKNVANTRPRVFMLIFRILFVLDFLFVSGLFALFVYCYACLCHKAISLFVSYLFLVFFFFANERASLSITL